jgi:cell division inhibitor SepF
MPVFRKTMVFLGLADDDYEEYDEYDEYDDYDYDDGLEDLSGGQRVQGRSPEPFERELEPRAADQSGRHVRPAEAFEGDPREDLRRSRGIDRGPDGSVIGMGRRDQDFYGDHGDRERLAPPPKMEPPRTGGHRQSSAVRTIPAPELRVAIVEPESFDDAEYVGSALRNRQPVVMDLRGLPRDLMRRLIDFASGSTFVLDGSMERTADQVFLLTPDGVNIPNSELDRLREEGLLEG